VRSPNRFHRDGAVWVVSFEGLRAHLADSKGFHDLTVLLGRPGTAVPAHELAGAVAPSSGAPMLDRQALTSYRRRIDDLDGDIAEAESDHDLGRAAIARIEREALLGELGAAIGLGGRARRLGDDAERARKTVTTRVFRALARIDRVHAPLGAHLRASIRTGATCCYEPAAPIEWRL
jgi:hypothetical protein